MSDVGMCILCPSNERVGGRRLLNLSLWLRLNDVTDQEVPNDCRWGKGQVRNKRRQSMSEFKVRPYLIGDNVVNGKRLTVPD